MEPLTLIVSALTAGAAAASKDIVSQAVRDAYTGLKNFILHRVASKPEVKDALQQVEKKPDSRARHDVLKEELEAAGVSGDESVRKKARELLDLLKVHGLLSANTYHAQQEGSGAIAQGSGAIAAGERGVTIQGDVQKSTIITGNDNVIKKSPSRNSKDS
jgi:hypothetical protein